MFKGVHLTLMIGPGVARPVSKEIIDALESVEVATQVNKDVTVKHSKFKDSSFKLTFDIDVKSPLQTIFMIGHGVAIPLVRVIVAVTVNGRTDVLIDGVMTHHDVGTDAKDGHTTLSIFGDDLSAVMNYVDFSGLPYPAMPAEARVALALLKYAVFGVVPMVIPSIMLDVPIPTDQIPHHRGKDLKYIRGLAEKVGYVFYLEPGPAVGTSVAYWGPQIKVGIPQPPLSIDADASTNVESLSFTFNNERKTRPQLMIQSKLLKSPIPIPIPDINPLYPPLGLVAPVGKHVHKISGTAKLKPVQALLVGLAKAAQAADVVSAEGTLDVARYGRVLKPHKLVGLRGAGLAFDGLWYVDRVTHQLKRGEYKQQFTLTRNGLVSTLPVLPQVPA